MIKLLIADDEKNVRDALAEMVGLYSPNVNIVASTHSVSSTIEGINKYKPDVVLLDIDLKDGTGFDVLKHYKNPQFKVIFITAFQQYALEAFRFSAIDYLLKPIDPDLFTQAVNKATETIDKEKLSLKIESFLYNMDAISKGAKKIILKTADNIHVVNVKDIMYCEADHSYTNFYLADKSRVMVSKTLGEYDELLSAHNFIRIHQSYLLNVNYIKRYEKGDGGNVILSDNTSLPVATRKKEQLMQFLSRL